MVTCVLIGVVTMVTSPQKDDTFYPNIPSCGTIKRWAKSSLNAAFLSSNIPGYAQGFQLLQQDLGIYHDRFNIVALRDFIAAQEVRTILVSCI